MSSSALEKALKRSKEKIAILEKIVEDGSRELYLEKEELRSLNQYLSQILETMTDAVIVVDCDLTIKVVNKSAAALLEFSSDELLGSPIGRVFDLYQYFPVIESADSAEPRTVVTIEAVFTTKSGLKIPVLFSGSVMLNDCAETLGYVCVANDLRERMALEFQIVQAEKLESVGRLAAGIAHEINTPIQFIGDNLHFLDDSFKELILFNDNGQTGEALPKTSGESDVAYLKAEIPKAISQSLQGVEKVTKIVRAMKEFSHPGTEAKQSVDINRLLESAITVSTNEWKYVAEVVTDFDTSLPLVACLSSELSQVSLNLIINAAHAIGDVVKQAGGNKGTITICTRKTPGYADIQIKDTGTGIPPEIRQKIFEPFFTTKRVGKGTGQGLAIARSIVVDKHGGILDFESEVGKGTTFIIRLPLSVRGT